MILLLVFLATLFLAFSNGANDNFKGVATLFGSGTATFRQALTWATITAALGAMLSIFLAQQLVHNFSGKGLVPDDIIATPAFTIAVAGAAALTVMLATRFGIPVSTTHGLVGALVGAGFVAATNKLNLGQLGKSFLLPLLISPLLAAGLSFLVYGAFKVIRKSFRPVPALQFRTLDTRGQESPGPETPAGSGGFFTASDGGRNRRQYLDGAHFLSAGLVCFARALNDTPKIAGLLLLVTLFKIEYGMVAIATAMALGGLLNSRRVADTMSHKITKLNPGQGLTANLVTGLLVTTASFSGLPVSTTHVSVGALFGIATASRQANGRVIFQIILSWVLTLPLATLLGALLYAVLVRML